MRGEEWEQARQRILEEYGNLLNDGEEASELCKIDDEPGREIKSNVFPNIPLPRNKLARFFILEIIALLFSAILIIGVVIAALFIIFALLNERFSDPFEEIPALIFWLLYFMIDVFYFSLPLALLVHIYIFKKYFIRRSENK
jgi:hypothetical protein